MTPSVKPRFIHESVFTKVEACNGRETSYCRKKSLGSLTFVSRAARALSQYYRWLQRTDKPW